MKEVYEDSKKTKMSDDQFKQLQENVNKDKTKKMEKSEDGSFKIKKRLNG